MSELAEGLRKALADRYTIERELGRGGMATVYLAQDLRHDRPVALKVLLPELASTLGPDRFLREIKLAARLQHPHILTVLDSGDAAGQLWFTMPYVEGESLRDRLRRERQLPLDDAVRITREAAQALEYAHQHGVVHRDIKPENLLLTRDGNTLVADFGIARAVDGGGDHLTQTGMSVGTPAYMSPEQAAGDPRLDARTDIYSLGCVLYEMLAGEPPFTGTTIQALLAKRMSGEIPRVRQVRPSVPESVEHAIVRALAPVAADRFSSAADFSRALSSGASATMPVDSVRATDAAATRVVAAQPSPRRRLPFAMLTMALGFAVGLGVLFAWRHSHGGESSSGDAGARRIAVLPFENLGNAQDDYFADGVTDAVRGKLTGLPGLEVIASNSSGEYKKSTKSPQQIAQELGVQYLVVGKVRWEKSASGESRVQVSPELIQATSGTAKWQQPFDASITDVFKVQADIAGQVAEALNLALGAGERQALAQKPTQNLGAYDAFLKGQEAWDQQSSSGVARLREAVGDYEQAVALDSGFVKAWAQLSRTHSLLYYNGSGNPEDPTASLRTAQRAVALAKDAPESKLAMGDYYNNVIGDFSKAMEQYAAGLRIAPDNADLITALGIAEQSAGRMDSALVRFHRSVAIDPRSTIAARRLGRALLWLRRYAEANQATDRGLSFAPNNASLLQNRVMIRLAQGDLAGARALIQNSRSMEPAELVAYFANYWDLFWALTDSQQELLLRLTPRLFDENRGAWGLALAATYALRGNREKARVYADSSRQSFEATLKATPEDYQSHALLGVALAYLGRKEDAIREAKFGADKVPISQDAYGGPYQQLQLVRVYILTGEQEKALDQLEPLLKIPFYLSPAWLKIDPTFDPLRKNPRFERLVKGDG